MSLDRDEVVSRISDELPEDALIEVEPDTIRIAVRIAFEFSAFLDRLPETDVVLADAERVADGISKKAALTSENLPEGDVVLADQARIAEAISKAAAGISENLEELYNMRDVAESITVSLQDDPYEDTQNTNETTVACAPLCEPLKEIARVVRETMRPIQLRWRAYPGVRELKEEHATHFERLRADSSSLAVRIEALLDLCRLQILFLANTFC
jgi:hypothetical protein